MLRLRVVTAVQSDFIIVGLDKTLCGLNIQCFRAVHFVFKSFILFAHPSFVRKFNNVKRMLSLAIYPKIFILVIFGLN